MAIVLQVISGSFFGSLLGLVIKEWYVDRRASLTTRDKLYTELLAELLAMNEEMNRAAFTQQLGSSREGATHEMDAKVTLHASKKVGDALQECLTLWGQFWVSVSVGAPAELGEDNFYEHNFNGVAELDLEGRELVMRTHLGRIADEHKKKIAGLARVAREEVGAKK